MVFSNDKCCFKQLNNWELCQSLTVEAVILLIFLKRKSSLIMYVDTQKMQSNVKIHNKRIMELYVRVMILII